MDLVFSSRSRIRTTTQAGSDVGGANLEEFKHTCLSGKALDFAKKLHPLVLLVQAKRKRGASPSKEGEEPLTVDDDDDDGSPVTLPEPRREEEETGMTALDTLGGLPPELRWSMLQELLDHRRLLEGVPMSEIGFQSRDYRMNWTDEYLVRIFENATNLWHLFGVFRQTSGIRRAVLTPLFRTEMYRRWYHRPLMILDREKQRRPYDDETVQSYPIPPPSAPRKTETKKTPRLEDVLDVTWYRTFLYDVLFSHYLFRCYTAVVIMDANVRSTHDRRMLLEKYRGILASPPTPLARVYPRQALKYMPVKYASLDIGDLPKRNRARVNFEDVLGTPYWHPGIFNSFEAHHTIAREMTAATYPGSSLLGAETSPHMPPVLRYYHLIQRAAMNCSVIRLPEFDMHGVQMGFSSQLLIELARMDDEEDPDSYIYLRLGKCVLIHDRFSIRIPDPYGTHTLEYATFPVHFGNEVNFSLSFTRLANKATTEEWISRLLNTSRLRGTSYPEIQITNVYHRIGDPSWVDPAAFRSSGAMQPKVMDGILVLVLEQGFPWQDPRELRADLTTKTTEPASLGWVAVKRVIVLSAFEASLEDEDKDKDEDEDEDEDEDKDEDEDTGTPIIPSTTFRY